MRRANKGFTIVELLVVIVVIGILVGLIAVSYGDWRTRVAKTAVRSDLIGVATAMHNQLNFSGKYPLSLPTTFTPSQDVTLTWAKGTTATFCINGVSKTRSSVKYYISDSLQVPYAGTCP